MEDLKSQSLLLCTCVDKGKGKNLKNIKFMLTARFLNFMKSFDEYKLASKGTIDFSPTSNIFQLFEDIVDIISRLNLLFLSNSYPRHITSISLGYQCILYNLMKTMPSLKKNADNKIKGFIFCISNNNTSSISSNID